MDYIIFIIKIYKIVLKKELFICHLSIVNIYKLIKCLVMKNQIYFHLE